MVNQLKLNLDKIGVDGNDGICSSSKEQAHSLGELSDPVSVKDSQVVRSIEHLPSASADGPTLGSFGKIRSQLSVV